MPYEPCLKVYANVNDIIVAKVLGIAEKVGYGVHVGSMIRKNSVYEIKTITSHPNRWNCHQKAIGLEIGPRSIRCTDFIPLRRVRCSEAEMGAGTTPPVIEISTIPKFAKYGTRRYKPPPSGFATCVSMLLISIVVVIRSILL